MTSFPDNKNPMTQQQCLECLSVLQGKAMGVEDYIWGIREKESTI